jgi:hypothetical protein
MMEIIRDHFWACWWLALILGYGVLELIETAIKVRRK